MINTLLAVACGMIMATTPATTPEYVEPEPIVVQEETEERVNAVRTVMIENDEADEEFELADFDYVAEDNRMTITLQATEDNSVCIVICGSLEDFEEAIETGIANDNFEYMIVIK